MELTVETTLPEVFVAVVMNVTDYFMPVAVRAPGDTVIVDYGVFAVADLSEIRFEHVTAVVYDRDQRYGSKAVPVDYVLVPEPIDLWLGPWRGTVRQTVHPDFTTSIAAQVWDIHGESQSGHIEIRTVSDSGTTDFVAQGSLSVGTVSPTVMSGHLTCHRVTGTLFGSPVSSCRDIFEWSTSGFTAELVSGTDAIITIDDLAMADPAFTDIEVAKLVVEPTHLGVDHSGDPPWVLQGVRRDGVQWLRDTTSGAP